MSDPTASSVLKPPFGLRAQLDKANGPLAAAFLVAILVLSALFVLAPSANKAYGNAEGTLPNNGLSGVSAPSVSASPAAENTSIVTDVPYGSSSSISGSAANLYPTQQMGYSEYSPDLWNIASTSVGSVYMSSSTSGVTADVSFTSLGYGSSGATVIGYPNVMYGYSPWGGGSTQMSNALILPKQIAQFNPTLSVINYTVNGPVPPMDFAYDIWITQTQQATTVSNGDLELMIWTDHANGLVPAGGYVIGTFTTNTEINGTLSSSTWNIYVSNGNRATATTWTIVTFQLQSATSAAQVGINLTGMFSQMIQALTTYFPQQWSKSALQGYYVEQIDLGSEFANPPGLNFIVSSYTWTLSSWYLLVNCTLDNLPSAENYPATQATATGTTSPFASGVDKVDDTSITGERATLSSPSTPDGTQVLFETTAYDSAAYTGTGALRINGNAYYSVQLSSASSYSNNTTAEISISSGAVSSSTKLEYLSGGSWISASGQSLSGTTVSGYVPLGFLGLVVSSFHPRAYSVTFQESGLAAGTRWSAILNGTLQSTTGNTIQYNMTNGTYSFTAGNVTGYSRTPASGTVTVQGTAVLAQIAFTAFATTPPTTPQYNVTFTESGIPAGTNWSVSLGGSTAYSLQTSISFHIPNGTYPFAVNTVSGYASNPASGTANVSGSSLSVSVSFTLITVVHPPVSQDYAVVFEESGLPYGMSWTMEMNGTTQQSTTASITYMVGNGTYYYSIYDNKGYHSYPSNGAVTVSGHGLTIGVVWAKGAGKKYMVTFSAPQLTTGSLWSVTMYGETVSTANGTVVIAVPNGTYLYNASFAGPNSASAAGEVNVNGSNVSIEVLLQGAPPASGYSSDQLLGLLVASVVTVMVSIFAIITAIRHRADKRVSLRRRRY